MIENQKLKDISLPSDLGSDYFHREAAKAGHKGGFDFYINNILTRGVCSVNLKDQSYVLEVISSYGTVWYERRGFFSCIVRGNGYIDSDPAECGHEFINTENNQNS